MSNEIEIWKDVIGYESYFKINQFYDVIAKERTYKNKGNTGSYRIIKSFLKKFSLPKIGYYIIKTKIDGKHCTLLKHRLIWEYHNGPIPPKHEIHHIDENKLNNDISNLKCTPKRNHMSEHKYSDIQSKFTGVYWCRRSNKWKASIHLKGRSIRLGTFEREIDAANAYKKALSEIEQGLDLNILYPKRVKTSQYLGVSKCGNRWRAVYKDKHIGLFKTELEAHEAVQNYIKKLLKTN